MQAVQQNANFTDSPSAGSSRMPRQELAQVDNRQFAVAQLKLGEMMNSSPQVARLKALSDAIHNSPQMVAQRHKRSALVGWETKPQGDCLKPADASLAQCVDAVGDAPVQRTIKKRGRRSELYLTLSRNVIEGNFAKDDRVPPSTAMINELQKLHRDKNETYTWAAAINEATRRIKKTGAKVVGRANRLINHKELISYAESFGIKIPKVVKYITKHRAVFDAAMGEVEFAKGDFPFGPRMTDSKMKKAVTDTMMAMPATLTRTISAFDDLANAQVRAHSVVGSSWKGNQFEQWVDANVFPALKCRETFSHATLSQVRTCDGYDSANDVLWDYKHCSGSVPPDQAKDYDRIVKNGIASANTLTPTSVSYLFNGKAVAETNAWLNTKYGFGVWYVDSGLPPTPVQLY